MRFARLNVRNKKSQIELSLPGLGLATLNPRHKRVTLTVSNGFDREQVQSTILNQIIPFAMSHLGELLLHGAAVEIGDEAVLFVGRKGQGKSTLAAAFAKAGFNILSDDVVRVRLRGKKAIVFPSFPEIRVFERDEHHYRTLAWARRRAFGKSRMDVRGRFGRRALPLRGIMVVHGGKNQKSGRKMIEGPEAFGALMNNTFTYGDLSGAGFRFEQIVRLSEMMPVWTLGIRHAGIARLNVRAYLP